MQIPAFRLYGLALLFVWACQSPAPADLSGSWRATLALQQDAILPFNFELQADSSGAWQMVIRNAEERLPAEAVELKGDSIYIQLSVFDSRIRARLTPEGHMQGYWENLSRGPDYRIPFEATPHTAYRFEAREEAPPYDFSGRWEVHFSPGSEEDHYPAVGIFRQEGQRVTGTFLTETGDYRFLEGIADGRRLRLSAFDGAHAFLFEATLDEQDSLRGVFYSGNHWEEPFVGAPKPDFQLRDAESLTYLKAGYDRLSFRFPNLDSSLVSLEDARYRGKVVIVQLMGSWCPNCMDETRLYCRWYEKYQPQGLEIIALAYERASDFPTAVRSISRLKQHFNCGYEFLIANYSTDKEAAARTLPMLNRVIAYPTSIFIDRQGRVRKIHTGFNGPGTGPLYTRFVEQYTAFIEQLLAEEATP